MEKRHWRPAALCLVCACGPCRCFADVSGAQMQLQPEEGAVFEGDGWEECHVGEGVLHLRGGLQWVQNKGGLAGATHPPAAVHTLTSSSAAGQRQQDLRGFCGLTALPGKCVSLLSIKLCLLCKQPSLWRAQRSLSLTCVAWWPSTVSAGELEFSLGG